MEIFSFETEYYVKVVNQLDRNGTILLQIRKIARSKISRFNISKQGFERDLWNLETFYLVYTIRTRCMWEGMGEAQVHRYHCRGDRRFRVYGWSFNKMELIFIWYINNDRNKVGYRPLAISLIRRRCREIRFPCSIFRYKLVPGMYKLLFKLFYFII